MFGGPQLLFDFVLACFLPSIFGCFEWYWCSSDEDWMKNQVKNLFFFLPEDFAFDFMGMGFWT